MITNTNNTNTSRKTKLQNYIQSRNNNCDEERRKIIENTRQVHQSKSRMNLEFG